VLLGLLLLLLLWSGIRPHSRFDWFLDNALGFVLLVLVVVTGGYFRLSNISYTALFVFMAIHVIGSHWTYQETPFGFTLAGWFRETERNRNPERVAQGHLARLCATLSGCVSRSGSGLSLPLEETVRP
jgi:uncharacterized membrane protein YjdF